jgi:hypothetical protein
MRRTLSSGSPWAMILPTLAMPLPMSLSPENFDQLEVAWEWDGASFGAVSGRATPSLG